MKKVFVSSVIRGFEAEREAAKKAIEAVSLRPIMSEDFGAKPHSPKIACLDGVRTSNIYVGIAGERYGFVTTAGISVTEEEFEEARRRGLPVVWFVANGKMEPKQEAFVERISGYEEGYFISRFENTKDLILAITKAMSSIVGQPGVELLNPQSALALANKYLSRDISKVSRGSFNDPCIVAVLIPERQGEDYLSALDLGNPDFKSRLQQPALFGEGAVFDRAIGTAELDGREDLSFEQRGQFDQLATSLQFHTDGTLIWRHHMTSPRSIRNSLAASHVLDQEEMERRLSRFFTYAKWYYGQLGDAALISSLYMVVVIAGSAKRKLGHIPNQPLHSISIGMGAMEDPLVIPERPMKVPRAELNASERLAAKVIALAERAYRAAGHYFEPEG